MRLCPQQAITEEPRQIGHVEKGTACGMVFVHGRLTVGEVLSPPVIREVKKHIDYSGDVIIDAPPGTACPVIEAVKGNDFCLLVTEPTPFGLHDLKLAVEVMRKLSVRCAVVINRSGKGDVLIEDYCRREGVDIFMKIPFSRDIASAYADGIPLVEAFPEYKGKFTALYEKIKGAFL